MPEPGRREFQLALLACELWVKSWQGTLDLPPVSVRSDRHEILVRDFVADWRARRILVLSGWAVRARQRAQVQPVCVDGARQAAVESTASAVGLECTGVARLLRLAERLAGFVLERACWARVALAGRRVAE